MQALAVYEKHLGADNESTAAIVRAIGEPEPLCFLLWSREFEMQLNRAAACRLASFFVSTEELPPGTDGKEVRACCCAERDGAAC